MDSAREEAQEALATAAANRRTVVQRAPWEYRVYLAWGLFVLLMLPPFDFVDHNLWGPVILVVAACGMAATAHYFRQRGGQVRLQRALKESRWRWVWSLYGVWYLGVVSAARLVESSHSLAWSVAALAAGLPLIAIGAAQAVGAK